MRRFILFLTILSVILSFGLVGCKGSDDGSDSAKVYNDFYSYNATHHWRREVNGTGQTDYAEHENNGGKCKCGMYYTCADLTYTLGTVNGLYGYIVSAYNGADENAFVHIEIPAYYNGEKVVSIANNLFSKLAHPDYKSIKSIKINEGVNFIGKGAFAGTDIEEIIIPNSVYGGNEKGSGLEDICNGCAKLKRAVIGSSLYTLDKGSFEDCVLLEDLVIENGVYAIKQGAFDGCLKLKQVVIPNTLSSIPESSVYDETAGKFVSKKVLFPCAEKIYLAMSQSEFYLKWIKVRDRDATTGYPKDITDKFVHPSEYVGTDFGLVDGWMGDAEYYFQEDWYRDLVTGEIITR